MALGALTLGNGNVGFDAAGTSMVPVSSGDNKVGKIEIKSPFETFKDTFTKMQESLGSMVGLQTKEEKRQEFINKKLLEQHEFERKMMNEKMVDEGIAGPEMPSQDQLAGVDTDDKTYGNFVEKAENVSGNILDSIKEAFGNVSFGPKMTAILFAGGLVLFMKYKDQLTKVLTPIVQFVMDMVDTFGPGKVFAAFIGGFLLLKSGLAKKAILFAGQNILKGIKASAAAIDKQGGLVKAVGNGFEKINRGMGSVVAGAKKAGGMITGGLTKGFSMLGRGLTALRLGVMSMYSSIMPMIAPFLPIIAIAAAVVAVFFALKSGFETFKQSLEDGDSMFTAVLKGLGDAMLTLVTLPYVLIQKLVGFVAGLFGFDNFKEKLESFDIKEQIVNALGSLVGGLVKILKAVAKGAGAALAAVFRLSNPIEAFQKAYQEVMAGGEGDSAALQGTSDYQGDQSQKEFNEDSKERDKVKGFNKMDTSEMGGDLIGGDEGQGTGNATAISYYKKQEEERRYRDLGTGPKANISFDDYLRLNNITQGATGSDDFGGVTDPKYSMAEMAKGTTFESKQVKTQTLKYDDGSTKKTSDTIVIKGGDTKQGDTINQMSQTNITGDLEVNNQERTQRAIQELAAF